MVEAFNYIYDNTYSKTLRFVISKCDDMTLVEDIMQNIYMNIYKVIKKKGRAYIKNDIAFVIDIAKKEIFKHYRSKRDEIFFSDDVDNITNDREIHHDKELDYLNNILNDEIWNFIKKEDNITQKIMTLYYLEDTPLKEIANILKMNENSVKTKLYRCLSILKERYGDVK